MEVADLHLHTTQSDGRLSVCELIDVVAVSNASIFSITDHDTTNGLDAAAEYTKKYPHLRLIPGIELSADIDGDEIHVLGYFLDYQQVDFQRKLTSFRDGRITRAQMMIEKLSSLGMEVSWDRVQEIAGDGTIGRPHIALALVEEGYFDLPKEAFVNHLNRTGLAYAEVPKISPQEAVQLIKSVNGVAVLAHPFEITDMTKWIGILKEEGLDGLEVYYGNYGPSTVEHLLRLSRAYDLVPAGGSDFHGLGNPGEVRPGTVGTPIDIFDRLERLVI